LPLGSRVKEPEIDFLGEIDGRAGESQPGMLVATNTRDLGQTTDGATRHANQWKREMKYPRHVWRRLRVGNGIGAEIRSAPSLVTHGKTRPQQKSLEENKSRGRRFERAHSRQTKTKNEGKAVALDSASWKQASQKS
jgi:hypothetical protein